MNACEGNVVHFPRTSSSRAKLGRFVVRDGWLSISDRSCAVTATATCLLRADDSDAVFGQQLAAGATGDFLVENRAAVAG